MSEMEEKLIEVSDPNASNYARGQHVNVVMTISSGNRAVLLGYFYPLLILLTALIVSLAITSNEGWSGLISIAVLIPYYFVLWLRRDHLKKKTSFSVK